MAEKGPASMSVAISRGSETLVQRVWGVADITTKRPATAARIYKIGSVSKQCTAVLLLRQVERGTLATDSISRYLTTGLRPEWRPLTIGSSSTSNNLRRRNQAHEPASYDRSDPRFRH